MTTEPHPTHTGLNIFARDKDGNVKARLCAIDSTLTLFDESNSDSLSRVTTEPHPTHTGLNIFARDKDGNVKARLCAIDSTLTLFDESNNAVWSK